MVPSASWPTVRYALDTPVGELRAHPYGDWVACWFEEPARAAASASSFGTHVSLCEVPLNTYSGKWNHHFFERVTAAEALGRFRQAIEEVLQISAVEIWCFDHGRLTGQDIVALYEVHRAVAHGGQEFCWRSTEALYERDRGR